MYTALILNISRINYKNDHKFAIFNTVAIFSTYIIYAYKNYYFPTNKNSSFKLDYICKSAAGRSAQAYT